MKNKLIVVIALLCLPAMPLASMAADFDGSQPLLCTVTDVTECIMGEGCKQVSAEEINLPRHLWINVAEKTIQSKRKSDESRKSTIENVKEVDKKLILQGAEQGMDDRRDGFGWTMAIMQDTGEMVLSASGDFVGDVVFGVCTPYEQAQESKTSSHSED